MVKQTIIELDDFVIAQPAFSISMESLKINFQNFFDQFRFDLFIEMPKKIIIYFSPINFRYEKNVLRIHLRLI